MMCNSKLSPSSLLYLPNGSHFLSLDLDLDLGGYKDFLWILEQSSVKTLFVFFMKTLIKEKNFMK